MANPTSQVTTATTPRAGVGGAGLSGRRVVRARRQHHSALCRHRLVDKAMSKLALDMTRHCIDLTDKIPRVVRAQVEAAVAEVHPPVAFSQGIAPTPAQLEAQFPSGRGDNQAWYVVCIGRQPGLYATADEADAQVLGVPDQYRRKVVGRIPALAYYRQMYDLQRVMRLTEIPT
ncbi:hypothetical protein B0H14DRAFT_3442239 [Mycena olivaceomarginata]|nr:hypothetical protein B0H14DRAFT_3442239 [Mycena olivaceomarginata]